MKIKIFTFFAVIFISAQLLYGQVGWFSQSYNTTLPLNSVCFVDALTGFAAGGNASSVIILKTTNSGTVWTQNFLGSTGGVNSIFFVNTSTGYVAGGVNPYPLIWKTTNTGQMWASQIPNISYALASIFFTNANTGYASGDQGTIIKTTNGGTNWISLNSGTTNYLESIYFVNDNTGFAAGRAGQILKTINAGASWSFVVSYGTWMNSVRFINSNTGYSAGQNGVILYTANSGLTWNALTSGTTNNLNEVYFLYTAVGHIAGNLGTILRTTNGGVNWYSQISGTTNNLNSIFFIDMYSGYAVGVNGTILKTATGGVTFYIPTLISPPNNASGVSLTPALAWTSGHDALYYKVQVSSVSNFSNIVDSATVTINQHVIPAGKLNSASTYFWRVNSTTMAGTGSWSDVWSFSTILTGINQTVTGIPETFNLSQNYPNPFNPITNVKFQISNSGNVKIIVFDLLGKEIATLVNETLQPGYYEVTFDGTNISSGVYFYKLEAGNFFSVKKMALIK